MSFVYWKKIFSICGIGIYRCIECHSIYIRFGQSRLRIYGKSCRAHLSEEESKSINM